MLADENPKRAAFNPKQSLGFTAGGGGALAGPLLGWYENIFSLGTGCYVFLLAARLS